MSGSDIGFFDPQQNIWPDETGQVFDISDLKHIGSVTAALDGLANFQYGSSNYPHTIFRLPLRTEKSELSDKVYEVKKVKQLVETLRQEAKYLLLFLNSVTTIKVIYIDSFTKRQMPVFSVSIDSKYSSEIVKQRQSVLSQIPTSNEWCVSGYCRPIQCIVDFKVTVKNCIDPSCTSHWIVATYAGSKNPEVLKIVKENNFKFPQVGAAFELSQLEVESGRVFCFLPLPAEQLSSLPIHVNGTFSLNEDRRSLKWPSVESANDETSRWNSLVMKYLLPECYIKLLLKLKDYGHEEFYAAWPNPTVMNIHWRDLLQRLYNEILATNFLWCARINCWVTYREAIFIPQDENVAEVVVRALTKCGQCVVDAPEIVWEALKYYGVSKQLQLLTPSVVRLNIKKNEASYKSEPATEKMELLNFCLMDEKYSDLEGIVLVPLADGQFKRFDTMFSTPFYVCSEDYPRRLFYNLDSVLIDAPETIQSKLLEVAKSHSTQLKVLNDDRVAALLGNCFPGQCLHSSAFPTNWLQNFWTWVQNHNLGSFVGVPILPLATQHAEYGFNVISLVETVQSNVVFVFVEDEYQCSNETVSALHKLRVNVGFQKYTPYVAHKMLHSFVHKIGNSVGILTAIGNANPHTSNISRVNLSEPEAKQLQHIMRSVTVSSPSQQSIIEHLPVFKIINRDEMVSVAKANSKSWNSRASLEPHGFLVKPTSLPDSVVIFSRTENQLRLFNFLNVSKPLTTADLLRDSVFPMITSLDSSKIDMLMKEIVKLIPALMIQDGESLKSSLASLLFLPTVSGKRKSPAALYDPTNNELLDLFQGKDVFPLSPFDEPKLVINLRWCGLQTSVNAQRLLDLFNTAIVQDSTEYPIEVLKQNFSRIEAIFKHISSYPNLLRETVLVSYQRLQLHQAFTDIARRKNCLPVLKTPPENYPCDLDWKGASCAHHLVAIQENVQCCTQENLSYFASLAGTQAYFVLIPEQFKYVLFTELQPSTVLRHFKNVLQICKQCKPAFIQPIVYAIYKFLVEHLHLTKMTSELSFLYKEEWIWLRKKNVFVRPSVLALYEHEEFDDSNKLEPYLYILPDDTDLYKFHELFLSFGAVETFSTPQIAGVLLAIKDDSSMELSASKQWRIVSCILQWLARKGKATFSAELYNQSTPLYVPVSSSSEYPQLKNIKDVLYTDISYLETFYKSKNYKFIHEKVVSLAHNLGVKRLSEKLNIAGGFGDVGPHQSIVTEINNILEDYPNDLTIVKELLQNADDAMATEVNICYDARSHTNDASKLLFPGTAQCHGPSLIVHNNRPFSDDDFNNIEKLAGATKRDQELKIGKFGVGFCSVYHITDIPSFVSRDWLYFFDPALEFLHEENEDKSRPGKRLCITQDIVAHSSQLDPYVGLFGFQKNQPYSDTIFRFPFRTRRSDLSKTIYDDTLIDQLVSEMKEAGSNLLLFLQHVTRITFSRINPTESELTLILEICKKDNNINISPDLLAVSNCAKFISIDVMQYNDGIKKIMNQKWIVGTYTSTIVFDSQSKYAISSAACEIIQENSVRFPSPLEGEVFCYLPLALKTGLPVHISSNFAIRRDRSGIHSSDKTSRRSNESNWNVALMQSIIPEAIRTLLVAIKLQCECKFLSIGKYAFASLWPLKENLKIENPWEELVQPTYKLIMNSNLFYSHNRCKWLSLNEITVLSDTILRIAHQQSLPQCVVDVIVGLKYSLVSLPIQYKQELQEIEIMNEKQFLNVFFVNFEKLGVSLDTRNKVLHLLLLRYIESDQHAHYLKSYLMKHKCIPCKPNGKTVKNCSEIVDPKASFRILYDEEDEVFPISCYENDITLVTMRKLKMISDHLPLKMVVERARRMSELFEINKELALKKVQAILQCISKLIQFDENVLPGLLKQLTPIQLLPVMTPPKNYPDFLCWHGSNKGLQSCVNILQGETNSKLVGSEMYIVCESPPSHGGCGFIPLDVLRTLNIRTTPSITSVAKHLQHIQVAAYQHLALTSDNVHAVKKWIQKGTSEIYMFFESELSRSTSESSKLRTLQDAKCIWTGEEFVSPQNVTVSKDWNIPGPILYRLPDTLKSKEKLIKALNITDRFSKEKLLKALKDLHSSHCDKPIGSTQIKLVKGILSQLNDDIADDDEVVFSFLPDKNSIMRETSLLVYNDAQWCKVDSSIEYYVVHYEVSRPIALKLGVKPIRSKALEGYESSDQHFDGVEFGQGEKLTERIKGILNEYPFDITIVKELLQNADDAKAKKLYFILDKRSHSCKKLPSPEWKDLQGPALLAWDDMGFTKDNLKGIQKLGLGSKRSESESIGQFGIGFNCVYHLTDCPSFFTNGNILCVFDPHRRYVPGATEKKPGRMYNKCDQKFWDNWDDIKSPYLRSSVSNCPAEISQSGSLFRFPLRCTTNLVKNSEVLDFDKADIDSHVLSADKMEENLLDWAHKIKENLIFLNSVEDMKFFIITGDNNMHLKFHYRACLEEGGVEQRLAIQHRASKFTQDGDMTPMSVFYPLTLSEEVPNKKSEKWVVQRAIGDSMKENSDLIWKYLKQIKPNHGLATPIDSTSFRGNLYCFLPLPIRSNLPVHINGNFILDATRNNISHHTDLHVPNEKAEWNLHLMEAIASSYCKYVVSCRSHFVESSYSDRTKIQSDCFAYYHLFPCWLQSRQSTEHSPKMKSDPPENSDQQSDDEPEPEKDALTPLSECQLDDSTTSSVDVPEGAMKLLAETVYKKLHKTNAKVHIVTKKVIDRASLSRDESCFLTEFHPLVNDKDLSKQVYFWNSTDKKKTRITPILKRIGLHLSVAPMWLKEHFEAAKIKLCEATPDKAFAYYKKFYSQVAVNGKFPCYIKNTCFQNAKNFKMFSEYLLAKKGRTLFGTEFVQFPEEPWGLPLLLTADNELRHFDKHRKVICVTNSNSADFYNIFGTSPQYFLHPVLTQLRYKSSYFLTEKNWDIVREIFQRAIPSVLQNVKRVKDVSKCFSKDKITLLWIFINSNSVFSSCLDEIVSEWALLLSIDGQSFSFSPKHDQLVPVIPLKEPQEPDSNAADSSELQQVPLIDYEYLQYDIYKLLSSHGMPVLDTGTCSKSKCESICPSFSKPRLILNNVVLLQKSTGLGTLFTRTVLDANIQKIMKYFAGIHFTQDKLSLSNIRSLPLFCDIGNQYQALGKEVYIWPENVPVTGNKKWLQSHAATFLPACGKWKLLGVSQESLGIKTLSVFSLYTNFIFPNFDKLTLEERLSHLEYIRDTDEIFNTAYTISKSKYLQGKNESEETLFVAALQQLSCLPINKVLCPLCMFCDPEEKMFQTFPEKIFFPPLEKEWLPFFRQIGLRTKPTKEEFVDYCQMVAHGEHSNILSVSKVLVDYFCFEKDWRKDEEFLMKISNIAFVCTHPLTRLAWIKSPVATKNIVQQGNKSFHLTTLRGSIMGTQFSKIVWTVKCIIDAEVPRLLNSFDDKKERYSFFHCIGISLEPSSDDVIQNLCNISKTDFSKFSNFHNYPDKLVAPKRSFSLVKVINEHFYFLGTNSSSGILLSKLRDIPCIPVCQEGKIYDIMKPVLVKPVSVVATNSSDLRDFLPFLNPLPDIFCNVFSQVLTQIGVGPTIQIEQVQYGLDTIKMCCQEPYDPNTLLVLKQLLKKLYQLLPSINILSEDSRIRSPLHLPDRPSPTGVLVDTKMLLFDDMGLCKRGRCDTSQVEYSFLGLLVDRTEEHKEYGFSARDLFGRMPTRVQPHPLSKCCIQELHHTCTPSSEENMSSLALDLKKAFSVSHFAKVVAKILTQHNGYSVDLCQHFSFHLNKFLEQLQVFTVKNLKVNVSLTLVNPPAIIGTAPVEFFFHRKQDGKGFTLYLKELSTFSSGISLMNLVENLSKEITKLVICMSSNPGLFAFNQEDTFKAIENMIRVRSVSELEDYLSTLNINFYDLQLEESMDSNTYKPKIGEPVPKMWHHRLQSDINNCFRPQDIAALEISEEEYIYVVVEHKISPDSSAVDEDEENEFLELDKYLINMSSNEDEFETKIVSVIELYKIFSVKEQRRANSDCTELVIWDEEDESVKIWDNLKGDKLKDIMSDICEELYRLSKIRDEDAKRKAIKAMYLKWHPDKNCNPLASRAFQFLQQQIQRLSSGLPLEHPREDWEPNAKRFNSQYDFDQWDEIVKSRTRSWQQEQRSYENSGFNSFTNDWASQVRTQRNPDRAKVWLEQAECDFKAMNILLEQTTCQQNPQVELSTHVCFLANQVAEKSVKAGMYQLCGLQSEGLIYHKFVGYAGTIEQERKTIASGLQSLSCTLDDYYIPTRYPNAFTPHAAPSRKFSPDQAKEAAKVAKKMLDII